MRQKVMFVLALRAVAGSITVGIGEFFQGTAAQSPGMGVGFALVECASGVATPLVRFCAAGEFFGGETLGTSPVHSLGHPICEDTSRVLSEVWRGRLGAPVALRPSTAAG